MFLRTIKTFTRKLILPLHSFALVAGIGMCLFLSASSSSVDAATFVVNSTTDANDATAGNGVCETATGNGICTLRAAISEANALAGDDIITLPAGTYTQATATADNTNASGDFDILSNITINGAGSGSTFIQAAAAAGTATERVIHFVPPTGTTITASLNGATIRYGRYTVNTFGGGMRVENAANVTLNDVVISDNTSAGRGGGVYVVTSTSSLTMNNSTITNNTSGVVTGATSIGGAGFYMLAGTATLNNTTVSNNQSINAATAATPPSTFGGGVTIAGGSLNLNNSTVTGNTASTSVASTSFGGGIAFSAGTVTLTNSSVTNNTSSATGTGNATVGGIDNELATLVLNNSTVSGNTCTGSVGGIRSLASGTAATTTINRSAIVNNSSPNIGGILNVSIGAAPASTTLNNSTVGGNSSNTDGGGIESYTTGNGNAVVNINYSTIASNTASANGGTGNGGGLANFGQQSTGTGTSTVNLQSSIVADNVNLNGTTADILGAITSGGYNHIENTTGGTVSLTADSGNLTAAAGDVTGSDPGLTPLALNGGTTLNYAPGAGSPVLDTIPNGTNGCGTTFAVDQRGSARPSDSNYDGTAACEKGSVEQYIPTAAASSVGGRILNPKGAGIAAAVVTITDSRGTTRAARSNSFGFYQFDNVESGQTFVFSVSAKGYQFYPQAVNITDNLTGLNFTGQSR